MVKNNGEHCPKLSQLDLELFKEELVWYNRTICLNSTDCNEDPLEYCNFDKDQMGFCEKCSSLLRDCVGENLFCYNGEKSCNETCGYGAQNIWAYDDDLIFQTNIGIAMIFPSSILIPILLVTIGVSIKLACKWRSKNSRRNMTWQENLLYTSTNSVGNEMKDFCFGDEDWMLPIWLQNKKEMIFYRSSVIKGDLLGRGQFGAVFKGKLVQGSAVFPIAIKTPLSQDPKELDTILDEAKNMIQLEKYHDHIVNLQGLTCEVNKGNHHLSTVSLLLEYCSKGDLKSFMVDHRKEFYDSLNEFHNAGTLNQKTSKSAGNPVLDIKILHRWIFQIADGMEFLTGKEMYHGDLAARNVLLTDSLDVKISDFGLSRQLYRNLKGPQALKFKNDEESMPLPIRWLALEVLTKHQIVAIKSDVWSFGVTTWEIFSIGKLPYWEGIDVEQLIKDLSFGIRLQKPIFCPRPIATLMEKCFHASPDQRPNFEEIKAILVSAYEMLCHKIKQCSIKSTGLTDNNINQTMQCRYATVIQMNKEQKERDYISRKENPYLYMKKASPPDTEQTKTETESAEENVDEDKFSDAEKNINPDEQESKKKNDDSVLIDVTLLNNGMNIESTITTDP